MAKKTPRITRPRGQVVAEGRDAQGHQPEPAVEAEPVGDQEGRLQHHHVHGDQHRRFQQVAAAAAGGGMPGLSGGAAKTVMGGLRVRAVGCPAVRPPGVTEGRDQFAAEVLAGEGAGVRDHGGLVPRPVQARVGQGRGQGRRRLLGEEDPVEALAHRVQHAAGAEGHHRPAGGRRLQRRDAEVLQAREHEAAAVAVQRRQLVVADGARRRCTRPVPGRRGGQGLAAAPRSGPVPATTSVRPAAMAARDRQVDALVRHQRREHEVVAAAREARGRRQPAGAARSAPRPPAERRRGPARRARRTSRRRRCSTTVEMGSQ